LFVPAGRALERAGVTPTALDRLRQKAAAAAFTDYELTSALPLAALAEDNDELGNEKLLAAPRRPLSPRPSAELDRLLEAVAPTVDVHAREVDTPQVARAPMPTDSVEVEEPPSGAFEGGVPPEPANASPTARAEADI